MESKWGANGTPNRTRNCPKIDVLAWGASGTHFGMIWVSFWVDFGAILGSVFGQILTNSGDSWTNFGDRFWNVFSKCSVSFLKFGGASEEI